MISTPTESNLPGIRRGSTADCVKDKRNYSSVCYHHNCESTEQLLIKIIYKEKNKNERKF